MAGSSSLGRPLDPLAAQTLYMDPERKSALIRVDMRGPSRAADCLDGVVAFPGVVERMRASGDGRDLVRMMFGGTEVAFESLRDDDLDGLLLVAGAAQDLLYRHLAEISIVDGYTRLYCEIVVRYFFEQLSEHGIRTFFILDNSLREDRLAAILELFESVGISTATPARDGLLWPALAERIRGALEAGGHAAYIEPDALVNHLDAAKELGREIPCVATFRNLEPGDARNQVINMKRQ